MKREKTKYPAVFYIKSKGDDRTFYIRYYKLDKRIEEKIGRQSQGMTAAKANQIRTQRIQGKAVSNQERREIQEEEKRKEEKRWTFDRLWMEYLSTHQTKSIEICKSRYSKHIAPIFGDKEPSEIAQLDVARFRRGLNKSGLKPGSVNKVLELFRRITNFGKNNRLVLDIEYSVKLDKVDDEKTEYLSPEQFQDLWRAIESDSNEDAGNFMKMVIFTGMRKGELLKLQKSHIDWQTGFINIVDPKGRVSARIPLHDPAAELLKHQSEKYPESLYFFPGKDGGERVNIKRGVNRIRKVANLPKDFRPLHGLRHQFATMLVSSGKVDLYTLQKLLNHKDPKMTQRYAHIVDESLRRGSNINAELVNELIFGPAEKVKDIGKK